MITIVYPFFQGKAQGDELKFSIRSLCKYAQFDFEPVIIGDLPRWYNGKHIPVKALRNRRFTRAFDIAQKLEIICGTENISDDFVYMYDDQYFINPVTIDNISGAIAMNEIKKVNPVKVGSEVWRELMNMTVVKLRENGHEQIFNYETHLPRVLNKQKLKLILKAYELNKNPLLFNTIYFNEFFDEPRIKIEESNPIKAGIYKAMNLQQIRDLCKNKLILNNGDGGWNHQLNVYLKNTFPERCKFEK